jgi:hypothetical protein
MEQINLLSFGLVRLTNVVFGDRRRVGSSSWSLDISGTISTISHLLLSDLRQPDYNFGSLTYITLENTVIFVIRIIVIKLLMNLLTV